MAPYFGPARLSVAVDGSAVGVGRRLVISLQEENFCDAVVSQRTVLVEIEGLVEFGERAGEIALLLQRHPAKNRRTQLHVGRVGEDVMVGIDGDAPRASEGFDSEGRTGADYFEVLVFGFAVGVNTQVGGHAETVEILRNLTRNAE